MKKHPIQASCVRTLITLALAAAIPAGAARAAAASTAPEPITSELSAWRVVPAVGADPSKSGAESFEKADSARPGDLIEYRARYRNGGAAAVRSFSPVLPIPEGMIYMPSTARPAAAFASTRGGGGRDSYAPVPLLRKVRLADGSEVDREIAPDEYRSLRWVIGTLLPGQEVVVSLRARVAGPLEGASGAPAAGEAAAGR